MKLVSLCLSAAFLLVSACSVKAAQYSTINVDELERLLAGSEQEKAAATFYLGGALDALSLTNTMLSEQGTPIFCPGDAEDLRPATLAPKLLQHVSELRQKPRGEAALQQLSAGTVVMVYLSMTYPCDLGADDQLPGTPPAP